MSNCNTLIQESLNYCEGTPVYAGIRRKIFYTSKRNLVTLPSYSFKSDSDTIPGSPVLTGEFTLKEGAYFHEIDVIADKCTATSEAQGEAPSQTSLDKINAVHPGVGPEASMAAAYFHNSDNVYVFQDIAGYFRVVGIEDAWPTKATVSMDFGQGPSGTASTTIAIEGTNRIPFPVYTGQIMTASGAVSGKTADSKI